MRTAAVVGASGYAGQGSLDRVLGGASEALDFCHAGTQAVVVHGAGAPDRTEMKRLGIPVEFVDERHVTDPAALAVVRVSLVAVGAEVSAALGLAALPRRRRDRPS